MALQVPTSPERGIRSSFPLALMCTTCHWIPASASTHQGPAPGDLINQLYTENQLWEKGRKCRSGSCVRAGVCADDPMALQVTPRPQSGITSPDFSSLICTGSRRNLAKSDERTILKLTCLVRSTTPSSLERKRACSHPSYSPEQPSERNQIVFLCSLICADVRRNLATGRADQGN